MAKLAYNAISGQFVARLIEMQESPAFRVLSLSALRALSRIEIELAHHAGTNNGKLAVTFKDFEKYGIRRHSIGPALDELETLGFMLITQHGTKAIRAEYRRPNLILLTTRPELEGVGPERCKWLLSVQDDRRGDGRPCGWPLRQQREKPPKLEPVKKFKSRQCRNGTVPSAETAPQKQNRQCRKDTTTTGLNGSSLFIFPVGTRFSTR